LAPDFGEARIPAVLYFQRRTINLRPPPPGMDDLCAITCAADLAVGWGHQPRSVMGHLRQAHPDGTGMSAVSCSHAIAQMTSGSPGWSRCSRARRGGYGPAQAVDW